MNLEIHVGGLDDEGHVVSALVDAGFDDALITQHRHSGRGTIEFDVDQVTVEQLDAYRDTIERCGARALAFGPTDLVSAADIAERIRRSRQSVTMLAKGRRGPGGFPDPINPGGRSELCHWPDVVAWLTRHRLADIGDIADHDELDRQRLVGQVNATIHLAYLIRSA